MNISLYMLDELLTDYETNLVIKEQEYRTIESVLFFTEDTIPNEKTVYLGSSLDVLGVERDSVICLHGKNYIEVKGLSLNLLSNVILKACDSLYTQKLKINDLLTSDCMLKDILNVLSPKINNPIMVLDNGQTLLAAADDFGKGTVDSEWDYLLESGTFHLEYIEAYNNLYSDRLSLRDVYVIPPELFPFPSYNRNIYIDNEFVGILSIIQVNPIRDAAKDWFDILYSFVTVWINMYTNKNEFHMRHDIVTDLISGDNSKQDLFYETMKPFGWKKKDKLRILVASGTSAVLNSNTHLVKFLMHLSPAVYALEWQNKVVILVNESLLSEKELKAIIQPSLHSCQYYCGASQQISEAADFAHYYMQAMVALNSAPAIPGKVFFIEDFAMQYCIRILQEHSLLSPIHPALNMLLEYDRLHNSNLYNVLDVYLRNSCNQTQASEVLFMHRNTLIRKIEKIQELCKIDLGDYNTRLFLMLSYAYIQTAPG